MIKKKKVTTLFCCKRKKNSVFVIYVFFHTYISVLILWLTLHMSNQRLVCAPETANPAQEAGLPEYWQPIPSSELETDPTNPRLEGGILQKTGRGSKNKAASLLGFFHMLRTATSAVLRSGDRIIAAVQIILPGSKAKPQPLCASAVASHVIRPFSVTACLSKKKKTSLWLEQREGQNMDGNMEEILAPLRRAVKEQVRNISRNDQCVFYTLMCTCFRDDQ